MDDRPIRHHIAPSWELMELRGDVWVPVRILEGRRKYEEG